MEENKKRVWVYDIETLSNCFTYTAIDRDSDEVIKFVIWKEKNEIYELLTHLNNCSGQIGFNNINFDYPVIHYIIKERNRLVQLDGDKIAKSIYKKAQSVISQEYSAIKESEVIIPQLDLFRIWHYDNKARMTGLKKLEIAMNFPNVQDMPYSHEHKVKTEQEVIEILDYNLNDVEATKVFYTKTTDKLNLRKGLSKKYNMDCYNFPDSKIGEQLMLKLYCHYTQQSEDEIKRKRTHRRLFKFAECIPQYIKFTTPEFNQLLEYLRGIEVTELKESFKYSFEYNGFTFDLGTGGIHGCIKPGIYKSTDTEIVVDCDVASLYPSLAITLNLYPEHLGEQFSKIYEEGIVKPRLEAKKNGDKVMADGFKLSANSVYGKSNSEYSFLYDPLYTLKTTLAGQLALCMLSEMLMTRVPNLTMLQINTDGLTVSIPVEHKRLYWNICQEWEEQTKLVLEYIAYSQMIIRDVNNYIAVSQKDNKVKYKGTFKPNNEMIKDGEYHKSLSQGIVSLAIADYFLKGIPVEQTIKENKDIYLFCKTFNATHGWYCETVDSEGNAEKQQKTNRYYISNNGKTFRKLKDERIIEIEAGGTKVTIFNKYEEKSFEEYNVDYDYYVAESYKIIHKIDGTEEKLEQERKEQREKAKRDKEEENYLKFCLNKVPTQLQYNTYNRVWLQEKYGVPSEIRPSKVKV
jgi:hypothetical protein